jgi:hypothetical protein
MRRFLLGGALVLLLSNLFLLLYFKGKNESIENDGLQLSGSSERITGKGEKSLFLQKDSFFIKLKFHSKEPSPLLSSVELELGSGVFRISGRAPRGFLIGKRLILSDFSGTACGWRLEARKFEVSLDRPAVLTLKKFSFVRGKELFKGVSVSTFEFEKLCAFLKKERKTPH